MKFSAIIAAAALSAVGAVPAIAQGGAYYTATAKGEVTRASVITRGTLWKCAGGVCTAKKAGERDGVLCELVVQRVGELSSFTVAGTPLGEDALAKCNARAR